MSADHLHRLFEDLEQQAEGMHLVERDLEVLDRARAEYARVTLADRVHASLGRRLLVEVLGVGTLEGTLARAGADWLLLETRDTGEEWVVRLAALRRLHGLSSRAAVAAVRPAVARLGFGSVLRGYADADADLLVCHLDGARVRGRVARVGEDFLELVPGTGPEPPAVVALATIGAVR